MSYHDSTTPKESRDTWCTPPEIYHALNREFHFVGDVAASDANHLNRVYLTQETDALFTTVERDELMEYGAHFLAVRSAA